MSFSLINPIFTKLSHIVRYCPTQLFTKSNLVPAVLSNSSIHSHLSKPPEFSLHDKKGEKAITESVLRKVNEEQINSISRTFAVVQVCGKQFKVTTDDVIIIEGYWPPDVGDKISLDKILCAGGENFSLIGTPVVQPGLINVHATVIEKNLSHTKTHFRKKRRKQYTNINFYRNERTVIRINDIGIGLLKETIDS